MPQERGATIADEEALKRVRNRLSRAQGQLGGVLRMLDEGRACQEVVPQLAAVTKAIDRAAFALIATSLRECLEAGETDAGELSDQLQELFLTLA
jgi:DNA-binding FrmR family transcriptional regulator